jgi:hypothetical protein
MVMEKLHKIMSLLACAAMITLAPVTAKALTDGSFETAGIPAWSTFNFAFQLASGSMASGTPQDGSNVLQTFGPFVSNWDASGAYQDIATTAGTAWTFTGYGMNPSGDAMQPAGNGFGIIQIAWNGGALGTIDSAQIDKTAGLQDQWQLLTAAGIAPVGTTSVRLLALHVNGPDNSGGSAYFDDLAAVAVPEPSSIALALTGLLGFVTVLRKRRA